MINFGSFIKELLPIYILIGGGIIFGKLFAIDKDGIAKLSIYMLSPVVVFYGIILSDLNLQLISLPFIVLILCSILCLVNFYIGKIIFKDRRQNLLAYGSASGNTGFFGIPLCLIFVDNSYLGNIILVNLGYTLFSNTTGLFALVFNRDIKSSINKLFKIPTIYAFFIAVSIKYFFPKLDLIVPMFENIKGAFIVIGLMLVGLYTESLSFEKPDYKFITTSSLTKFILCPAVFSLFILFDSSYLGFYDFEIYKILFLLSIVPLPADLVAWSSILNFNKNSAVYGVLVTTILGLFYIPIVLEIIYYFGIKFR